MVASDEKRELRPATEEWVAHTQRELDAAGVERNFLAYRGDEVQSLLDLIEFQRGQIHDLKEESLAYAAGVKDGREAMDDKWREELQKQEDAINRAW